MAANDEEFLAIQATIRIVFRSLAAVFITLIVTIAGCTVSQDALEFQHQRAMSDAGYEQVLETAQGSSGTVIHELWKRK